MRVFKTKSFARQAKSAGLSDRALLEAARELQSGLFDANLGGSVYKKRVPLPGRGKRGGARALVAFRSAKRLFFVFCYAKGQRSNVSTEELKALKLLASELLDLSAARLSNAMKAGELIEVQVDG